MTLNLRRKRETRSFFLSPRVRLALMQSADPQVLSLNNLWGLGSNRHWGDTRGETPGTQLLVFAP